MFRFLSHLLKLNYEECKGCETLKIQLEIANAERAELLKTILGLVKPEVIPQPTRVVQPIINRSVPWAIRKKGLEEKDREEARIKKEMEIQDQKLKPEIGKLEEELGVSSEESAS